MLTPRRAALLALLLPGSLAAQDNPFALTGGSVKTAYIVYEVSAQKQQPGATPTYEMGVAADRMIMKMVTPPVPLCGRIWRGSTRRWTRPPRPASGRMSNWPLS